MSGLFSAGVGILFGLPSLRIKGFYLAVATLAAQFFLIWLFNRAMITPREKLNPGRALGPAIRLNWRPAPCNSGLRTPASSCASQ